MRTARAEQRFHGLYTACERPVLAYALRRTMCRADAEDVVAETFLVAWRRLGDIPDGRDAAGDDKALCWLLGVARQVAANAYRGAARRQKLAKRVGESYRTACVTLDSTSEAMTIALAQLESSQSEALRLAYWEGLSNGEIALVLSCSANAVSIRLHRGRRALAAELAREGSGAGDIHPGAVGKAGGQACVVDRPRISRPPVMRSPAARKAPCGMQPKELR